MEGIITNIQRFSLNDGDGIRTTVFFKGCNMNCEWCHNPETIHAKSELMFYENKCIGCGKCFDVCPQKAHQVIDGKHIVDRTLCINCGKCAEVCYAEALVMCGKKMNLEDVMKEIRQDMAYYKNSGGGVTLSGGEVLCQKDFAVQLCKACHNEGIQVAIETNLCFAYEHIKELLENIDFVMCDLKIFDDDMHKKYTGVSNKQILENIKKIDALNIPVIVRTPLIPGATDNKENLVAVATYIKDMKNLKRYEILNFNPLGEGKYKGLNRENKFAKCIPFGEDKLEEISSIMNELGIVFKVV